MLTIQGLSDTLYFSNEEDPFLFAVILTFKKKKNYFNP